MVRPVQLDFVSGTLPAPLIAELYDQNPWWRGASAAPIPRFRRWPFDTMMSRLTRTPPLARINVVRGPRQIGKSTLLAQMIAALLADGVTPQRILRVQFDALPSLRPLFTEGRDAVLEILRWFERNILQMPFNQVALEGGKTYLFLDEVQNLRDWAIQLKAFVDRTDVAIVVTGSSALRLDLGTDSLAGRIQALEVGPFRLGEIAAFRALSAIPQFPARRGNGSLAKLSFWRELIEHGRQHAEARDAAFKVYSERGGYPLALLPSVSWPEAAAQLNDLVVKRVITHDLRIGERGNRRDEQLLLEVFRIAARYAGQSPSQMKLASQVNEVLGGNVGIQRVRKYLEFLDGSMLVRLVRPLEMRLKKQSGAQKICMADHGIRAAWLDDLVPLDPSALEAAPEVSDMAGRIAESCAGAFLMSLIDQGVHHLPERKDQAEIDFVLSAGDHRVPIEIKYQRRIDPQRDTEALRQFMSKPTNRSPIGVLVTRDDVELKLPAGIVALPLKTLLLME